MSFQQALDHLIEACDMRALEKAALELTDLYHAHQALVTYEHHLAYLVTRMPATLAAIRFVLQKSPLTFSSFLDIGSGPGSGYFALLELLPSVEKTSFIEIDETFITLAKKLGVKGKWISPQELSPHDLTLLSYCYGEKRFDRSLLQKAWEVTQEALILIEPGTPVGYRAMLEAREKLIEWGAYIYAPCPHEKPCPLPENDWCHFKVTLPRTRLHKQLKRGTLGYEDEKFSYVIATRKKPNERPSRILRDPDIHKGHVKFHLCTPQGIEDQTLSKKEKERYKKAKKCRWGDAL